jgi:predicted nucleic acid-binding protein
MTDLGSAVYVDANIFIYFIEGSPAFEEPARRFFKLANERRVSLSTSELTIAECLHGAHRLQNKSLAQAYLRLFDDAKMIRLVQVDRSILESAASVGAATRTKLIDAVHIASALSVGCDVFVTNDRSIRAPERLKILTPAEIE